MRFLVVNTAYSEFLSWLYDQHPGLEREPYDVQMQTRMSSLYGVADFYSANLRKLGHEAMSIDVNNFNAQMAWARERGLRIPSLPRLTFRVSRQAPWLANAFTRGPGSTNGAWRFATASFREYQERNLLEKILGYQIRDYAPDVLLNQAVQSIHTRFLQKIKPYIKLVAGQIASWLPTDEDFSCYDLMVSALPSLVTHFQKHGIPSKLIRLAFEPSILSKLEAPRDGIPVSFVGSLFRGLHEGRIEMLEALCERVGVQIWGTGVDGVSAAYPLIRKQYRGPAWGIQMYGILRDSKMTVNQHTEIAGPHAVNMRLYEATGTGTLLVTDWKSDLNEIFTEGKEVVAYRNAEDCAEQIRYYLNHEEERQEIARAGQQRTLSEHTYERRVHALIQTVEERFESP